MRRFFRLEHFRKRIDARVRHVDHRRVHFELAGRKCRRFDLTARQRVENGGLAAAGKSNDSDLHGISIARVRRKTKLWFDFWF